jgi:hypothetical protein
MAGKRVLWAAMPPPVVRLLDLYLLEHPDVPAPHAGMDVQRFRADFLDWWQRSNDPEVLAALRVRLTPHSAPAAPQRLRGLPPEDRRRGRVVALRAPGAGRQLPRVLPRRGRPVVRVPAERDW